jgi:uncharacterized damage-inducible protein DinB
MDQHKTLITELIKLLEGGTAHASFDDAIEGLSPELRGAVPDQLPYSIWQLVEHIRIAQWDMLEFSKGEKHVSPPWPDGYWVAETEPEDEEKWEKSTQQISDDRDEFIALLKSEDIYKTIAHGDGQSLLREALQIADHNAYHTAQIILIRRLLGDWE